MAHPITPAELERVMAQNVVIEERRQKEEAARREIIEREARKREREELARAMNTLMRRATSYPVKLYAGEIALHASVVAVDKLQTLLENAKEIFGELYDVFEFQEKRAYDVRGKGYTYGIVIDKKGSEEASEDEETFSESSDEEGEEGEEGEEPSSSSEESEADDLCRRPRRRAPPAKRSRRADQ